MGDKDGENEQENQEQLDDFSYKPDQNYDIATIKQQRDLENEISASQSLIGPLQSLDILETEYSLPGADQGFLPKIKELKEKYKRGIRLIRGDGNCFYRGFCFSCFEYLLSNHKEIFRLKSEIQNKYEELLSIGFPKFTTEDFYEMFMDLLDKAENDKNSVDIEELFNDQSNSDFLVVFLRLLVSGHLQKNEALFSGFIDENRTVKEFCNQDVEPMGRESDHIQIMALTNSLNIPVRIEYLDRAEGNLNHHDFPENSAKPVITLLYKPGHYDILY